LHAKGSPRTAEDGPLTSLNKMKCPISHTQSRNDTDDTTKMTLTSERVRPAQPCRPPLLVSLAHCCTPITQTTDDSLSIPLHCPAPLIRAAGVAAPDILQAPQLLSLCKAYLSERAREPASVPRGTPLGPANTCPPPSSSLHPLPVGFIRLFPKFTGGGYARGADYNYS
jgi:hypothetical protein